MVQPASDITLAGPIRDRRGVALVGDFFAAALQPRLDGEFLALTVNATLTTLSYAVLGTVLSLVLGLAGGLVSSQTWWRSGARGQRRLGSARLAGWTGARALLVVPRGIVPRPPCSRWSTSCCPDRDGVNASHDVTRGRDEYS